MPVVTETITAPDGTPMQYVDVTVRLVASTSGEAAGYLSAQDYTILGTWQTRTGADGVASLTLAANSLINPAGTAYTWTRKAPGRPPVTDYISVPNGAGPYVVEDILTDAPATVESSALAAHEATSAWDFFTTGNRAQRRFEFNADDVTGGDLDMAVVYALRIPDVRGGDLIEAFADIEVTNPHASLNALWDSTIILADSSTATTPTTLLADGEIAEWAGHNVTPSMHHGQFTREGAILLPSDAGDLGDLWVNYVAYGGGNTTLFTAADVVIVEPDYGRMWVRRSRSATAGIAPPATPAPANTLLLHLRAEDLNLARGAAVASWPDQSPTGATVAQATGAKQPSFEVDTTIYDEERERYGNRANGRAGVYFDGVDDCLTVTGLAAAVGPFTLVAVYASDWRTNVVNTGSYLLDVQTGRLIFAPIVNSTVDDSPGLNDGTAWVEDDQVRLAGTQIMEWKAATAYELWRNNEQIHTAAITQRAIGGTIKLGTRYDEAGGSYFKGWLFELRLYAGVLSAGDRTALHRYLGWKYGVAVA